MRDKCASTPRGTLRPGHSVESFRTASARCQRVYVSGPPRTGIRGTSNHNHIYAVVQVLVFQQSLAQQEHLHVGMYIQDLGEK